MSFIMLQNIYIRKQNQYDTEEIKYFANEYLKKERQNEKLEIIDCESIYTQTEVGVN